MRIFTFCLLFAIFGLFPLQAQQVIWLDANKSISTKENAVYYRVEPQKVTDRFKIVDYYKSGEKQMEGFSFTNVVGQERFDKVLTYYYKNGKKQQEFIYADGVKTDKYVEFYDTGEVKTLGKYKNDKKEDVWKTFYKGGKIYIKGKYKDGEKVGIWKMFYKNET